MRQFRLFAVLFFLGPLSIGAAEPEPAVFQVRTAGGTTATGPLMELGAGWTLRLGGDRPLTVEAGDLVTLRRAGTPLPPPPVEDQLLLTNGDRLPIKELRLEREQLFAEVNLGPTRQMTLPLSALAVVWWLAPDGTEQPDLLRRQLVAGQRKRDTLLLRNGDLVEGVLTGLNTKEAKVVLDVDRKAVTVELRKVAAVALSTSLGTTTLPKGPYARLILSNGARLSLASATCRDGQTLNGTTFFGTTVEIPLSEVVALDIFQGRAVYLSDLKPRSYEYTPYLGTDGLHWPYRNDRSVADRELRLAGSCYDKGLGVHSECRLTYDLAGGYRRFEVVVGLDEETGQAGSVRVKVLVDGKARDLGGDRELTGKTEPLAISLDVAGARELTLVVEFGRGGDVGDHVNWVDARLIK